MRECLAHGLKWFTGNSCPDCIDGKPPTVNTVTSGSGSLSAMWWTAVPAEVSAPVDANGSIVLEADSYVGPCPGTFGLSSCPEEIRVDDVGKDGKQRCWRCGWRAA